MSQKVAIIIGAGPAGLTAAYELLFKTDIKPIICEMSGDIGGISKTINYKGNRIDIGGARFFSKSDRVMRWGDNILPLSAESWKKCRKLYFTTVYVIEKLTKANKIRGTSIKSLSPGIYIASGPAFMIRESFPELKIRVQEKQQ